MGEKSRSEKSISALNGLSVFCGFSELRFRNSENLRNEVIYLGRTYADTDNYHITDKSFADTCTFISPVAYTPLLLQI